MLQAGGASFGLVQSGRVDRLPLSLALDKKRGVAKVPRRPIEIKLVWLGGADQAARESGEQQVAAGGVAAVAVAVAWL